MTVIRPDQILIVVLFLGLLGLAWGYVRLNRGALSGRIKQGKRIVVQEVTALSPMDRAMILAVDGREFLVLKSKGSAPVVTTLPQGDAQ